MDGKMKARFANRKHKLEIAHGVHISDDTLFFTAQLHQAFVDESTDTGVIRLVERACHMLRKSLDSDSEENNLDSDVYYLDRAFVEVMELRKEKSVPCRSVILPHVEKELARCTSKLESFQIKWAPVLAQLRHDSGKRVILLRYLRKEMVSIMNRTKLQGHEGVDNLLQLQPLLSNAINHLQDTIHSAFRERLFVGPREVAQVASSMSGLPLYYFHWPFKQRLIPRIEDLKTRLSAKLIGLDYVIHKTVHALSKQKSSRNIFGSFLLLGPHGCGRSKLAITLAEEIFGDKDRFIKLDMSQYKQPNYVSSLLLALDRDKKHGSVVMFDNIENAQACTYEVLSKILRDGELTDRKGTSVSFSDDIILVSSHIGHEVFCHCSCIQDTISKIPFQEILIEPALLHAGISHKACYLHQFYTKVAKQFKLEFMDLFNDVVVLPWQTPENHMAISRLQMRDVATSMSTSLKKQVILYPSDAAVQKMMCYRDIERDTHAYETWHKVYMKPMLNDNVLKNEADDMIIIYIDALVGLSNEFSFRVESSRHLEKYPILKSFKENLRKLRSRYRREKLEVNWIYRLQKSCFDITEMIRAKTRVDTVRVLNECADVVRLIDDLLNSELSDSNELELVQLKNLNGEVECYPYDRKMKRAEIGFTPVAERLRSSLEQQDKATQAIIEALLRHQMTSFDHQSKESNLLPASFLCLGLTPESKKQFAKSLGEHLVMDDGKNLLFQVDFSLCTEPDSFFWCAYDMETQLLLTDAIKRRPHSIVVFHHLEKAHISVFSTILSILDDGVSKDNEGNVTNFGYSVVVIVSDLGNKEVIGGLNGHCPENQMEIDTISKGEGAVVSLLTDEMGFRGLRFELLYQLDQLLLFDPFAGDQLNQFVKLPMKSLEEKSHSLYFAFSHLLNVRGKKKQGYNPAEIIQYIKEAVGSDMKTRYEENQVIPGSGDDPKISKVCS